MTLGEMALGEMSISPVFSVSGRATSATYKDLANKEHLPFSR